MMRRFVITILIVLFPIRLMAGDKSATRSGLMKLPAVAGTVQKEEGSFAFKGNSGSASFKVPLPKLPTRAGFGPNLVLSYSQQNGDAGSGFGIGWNIGIRSISMNYDKGTAIPGRQSNGNFYSNLSLDGARLVYDGKDGQMITFLPEVATSYNKIAYYPQGKRIYIQQTAGKVERFLPQVFEVTHDNGTKDYFGGDESSLEGDFSQNPPHITKWPLILTRAPSGDVIEYHYQKHAGRSYLKSVEFADGLSRFDFELIGTRSSLRNHKNGFPQSNGKLVAAVKATYNNKMVSQWCLAYLGRAMSDDSMVVRTVDRCRQQAQTDLAEAKNQPSLNVSDQLKVIYRFGRLKGNELIDSTPQQPNIRFDYSSWLSKDLSRKEVQYPLEQLGFVGSQLAQTMELADINNDSLVDIVSYSQITGSEVRLGESAWDNTFTMTNPWKIHSNDTIEPNLKLARFHFADIDGDSYTDLLQFKDHVMRVYFGDRNGEYHDLGREVPVGRVGRPAAINSELIHQDKARLLDLNNDGKTDYLTATGSTIAPKLRLCMNRTQVAYHDGEVRRRVSFRCKTFRLPYAESASYPLAQKSLKVIDVNGDALPDLVRFMDSEGGICSYENRGNTSNTDENYYIFGEDENDAICGHGRFHPLSDMGVVRSYTETWFTDVNSDGIPDFLAVSDHGYKLKAWLGFGNGDFLTKAVDIPLTTPLPSGSAQTHLIRVADIDADGQAELLVLNTIAPPEKRAMIIDFNRDGNEHLVKGNLLTAVQFSSGLRHDIRYATSTDEITRDGKMARLHFPVVLVKQIVTTDGYANGKLLNTSIQEMLYHKPYYDRVDRKFLGFEVVDVIKYGDGFQSPTGIVGFEESEDSSLTRETYHTTFEDNENRYLAGRLLKREIFKFTPHASYADQKKQKTLGALGDSAKIHSLSNYTRTQPLPRFGPLLHLETNDWQIVSRTDKTYWIRKLESYAVEFASGVTNLEDSRNLRQKSQFLDYDQYNIPHREITSREPLRGAGGITIDGRYFENSYYYEKSRAQLVNLDIVNLPDRTTVTNMATGKIIDDVSNVYDERHGALIEKSSLILPLENVGAIPVEVGASYFKSRTAIEANETDDFGNVTVIKIKKSETEPLQVLKSIYYDSRSVLAVKEKNALGHEMLLFYGDIGPDSDRVSLPAGFNMAQNGSLTHFRSTSGLWQFIEYDELGRQERIRSNAGGETIFSYKVANKYRPTMVRVKNRRYREVELLPRGVMSHFVTILSTYNIKGQKLANIEEHEEKGSRILSFSEYNRNGKLVIEWVPFHSPKTPDEIFNDQAIDVSSRHDHNSIYRYDSRERLSKNILPNGSSLSYSYFPWGHTITNDFDDGHGSRRVVTKSQVAIGDNVYGLIDELGQAKVFKRDVLDKITAIFLSEGNAHQKMINDNQGRIIRHWVQGSGTRFYSYNLAGELLSSVQLDENGGKKRILSYEYDILGRKIRTKTSRQLLSEYTYDVDAAGSPFAIGLLTMAKQFDSLGLFHCEMGFSYDIRGLITQKATRIMNGDGSFDKTYTETNDYTLDGVLLKFTNPEGIVTNYSYSNSNRLIAVDLAGSLFSTPVKILKDITYNPKGQLSTVGYHGGAFTKLKYHEDTLVLKTIDSLYYHGGTPQILQQLKMAIDGRLSITQILDTNPNSGYGHVNRSGEFFYNDRDELIEARRFSKTFHYRYTPEGTFGHNSENNPGGTMSDPHTPGQSPLYPLGKGGKKARFSAFGELMSYGDRVKKTQYDTFGRLVRVESQNAVVSFGYDHTGRRIYKQVIPHIGNRKTSFYPTPTFYNEGGIPLSYVFIGEWRLARINHNSSNWFYYLKDHLLSSDIIMSQEGIPVEQMLYRPYGSELDPKEGNGTYQLHLRRFASILPKVNINHRFTDHYLDHDTGLYYMNARYYSPQMGRFISPDPLYLKKPEKCSSRPISCNLYSYAGNNPLKYVDPSGFDYELARSGDTITVTMNIAFSGSAATKENVATIMKDINKAWDGKHTWTDSTTGKTYNVKFKFNSEIVSGKGAKEKALKKSGGNYVELNTGFNSAKAGPNAGSFDDPAVSKKLGEELSGKHEVGHFFMLDDTYDKTSKNPKDLMTSLKGTVHQEHINSILDPMKGSKSDKIDVDWSKRGGWKEVPIPTKK